MVRMKVRRIVAALGVLIAIAMTPRAAFADSYVEVPSNPIVYYNKNSAPTMLDANFNEIPYHAYILPCSSGSVSQYLDGSYDYLGVDITHNFDLVTVLGYDDLTTTDFSNVTPYIDYYYFSKYGPLYPAESLVSLTLPSSAYCLTYQVTTGSSSSAPHTKTPKSYGWREFVVDGVYASVYDAGQGAYVWQNISSNSFFPSTRYFDNGVKAICVRTHFTKPISSYAGTSFAFVGIDGLKLYYVQRSQSVIDNLNGDSGTPISSTIEQETQQQTQELLDTSGSDTVLSSQMGDGVNGFIARLGFIAQIPQMVKDLYDVILNTERNTYVHFPGVVVQGIELIPEQDVNVFQRGLGSSEIAVNLRYFNTIILFIAWFNGMKRLLEHQLLGESYDPTESVE